MTDPTYTDPTVADAQASTDYTTNAALIDEQAGLNTKTYAQTKQDTINSYQQALDSLNYGLQQAGVSARSQYAGRNLYNAGGDLSGTGQLEGTRLVQPSVNAITNLQVQHESNLNKLATAEQQGGLDIRAKKADLLNSVLTGLRNRAMTTYKDALQAKKDEEAQALERAKLPGGAIDTLKVTQEQQAKGRTKLYQKDLANAVKQYGQDAIIRIGDQKFLLSAQERTALAQAKKTLNKSTGDDGKPTTLELKTAFNKSINEAKKSGRIQTTAGGTGDITREQLIDALAEDHPSISRSEIAKEVYASFQ